MKKGSGHFLILVSFRLLFSSLVSNTCNEGSWSKRMWTEESDLRDSNKNIYKRVSPTTSINRSNSTSAVSHHHLRLSNRIKTRDSLPHFRHSYSNQASIRSFKPSFKARPKYKGPTSALKKRLGEQKAVNKAGIIDANPLESIVTEDSKDDCALVLDVAKNDRTGFINFMKRENE